MKRISKSFSILLVAILALSSLLVIGSSSAQSIPKPSIPEFTATYVDHSYDVPPTYGTDQYTGKTIVTKDGEHIDNRTVEITIKNQPFTSFNDSDGNMIDCFYDVRYKGSYKETWTTMFANQTLVSGIEAVNPYSKYGYAIQDYSSQYTTVIYKLSGQVPTNGQMDFQVESLEGYTLETYYDAHIYFTYYGFSFYGQESGWSNTQTVTIGETSVSVSPNPTLSPTSTIKPTLAPTSTSGTTNTAAETFSVPLNVFIIVVAVLVVIIVFLLFYRRPRKT